MKLSAQEGRLVLGALSVFFCGLCVPPYVKSEILPLPFLPGEFLPILEAPSHLLLGAFPDSLSGQACLLPYPWRCCLHNSFHFQGKNAVYLSTPLNWVLLQDGDCVTSFFSYCLTSTEPATQRLLPVYLFNNSSYYLSRAC